MTVQAVGQLSLYNQNDALMTGTAPSNPTTGSLWIDSSVTPNPMLKQWNGTTWANVGEMDATLSTSLSSINTSISNMTDDTLLDFKDRQQIKDDINNVIGSVIADTATTLPTTSTLDTGGVGSFYAVRRAALNAGISAQDTNYVALTTAYNNLATYLQGLTPKPWDAGVPNKNSTITVVPSTFRTNFLNYYAAEDVLRTETAQQLKSNVDTLVVGARNYLLNTSNMNDATNWSLNKGSSIAATFGVVPDTTYGNVINCNVTTNATSNNWIVIQNTGLTLPNGKFTVGNTYTISFLIWTALNMYVGFMDTNGANAVGTQSPTIPKNTGWTKYYYTFKATATGNTPEFYLAASDTTDTGNIYVTQVQLEDGSKATGYSPAPEDVAGQLSVASSTANNAYTAVQPDTISATVVSTDTFTQAISGKADASELGNYATGDQLSAAQQASQDYADQQIQAIDYSPYVTQTQMTQSQTDIDAKFTMTGGVNLVKNSVGFANTDMWSVTGAINTVQNDELTQLGFLSGFQDNTGVDASLSQTIYTTIGQYYTLSFYMRKDTDSTVDAMLGIYLLDANNTQVDFVGVDTNMGKTSGYQQYILTWQAVTATHTIKPQWGANTTGVITGIMVNIGYNALQWTMATGELYNSNIKMDMNGITVSQTLNGIETGRTVMTPTKFAGYYDVNNDGVIDETDGGPDEVFRMDQDEFVMKKATVTSEITMGGMKVIQVSSGAINGWAFVKYTT